MIWKQVLEAWNARETQLSGGARSITAKSSGPDIVAESK